MSADLNYPPELHTNLIAIQGNKFFVSAAGALTLCLLHLPAPIVASRWAGNLKTSGHWFFPSGHFTLSKWPSRYGKWPRIAISFNM
ncbi:hypothetical protein [Limimaricola soesokkakensis]|uniref:hypothetical protein n=1 Tax=Limimaricola soesokkakensis TaxID=1343159 RepID=UPI003519D704